MKIWILVAFLALIGVIAWKLSSSESESIGTESLHTEIYRLEEDSKTTEKATANSTETVQNVTGPAAVEIPPQVTIETRLRELLVSGTFEIREDGIVSYSDDAKIRLPSGPTISSGDGFMFSDIELTTFGGDLRIGSGSSPHEHRGLLELKEESSGFSLISFKEDIERELLKRNSNKAVDSMTADAPIESP